MSPFTRGFSLVEILLSLALGLVLMLGAARVFIGARSTHASQQAAMAMQDDARFVLGKMVQEIRLAGMFGCLSTALIRNAPADFDRPIGWGAASGSRSLTLVTADAGDSASKADWTVVSDCTGSAQAYAAAVPLPTPGQIRFPVRKLTYTFESSQLKLSTPAAPAKVALVDNVRAFDISFGVAAGEGSSVVTRYDASPVNEALIRSVRIVLTLQDPRGLVRDQTYGVVAALRNRLE
ncbi:PilW family protein [Pseudomonas sp. SDO528_S397]